MANRVNFKMQYILTGSDKEFNQRVVAAIRNVKDMNLAMQKSMSDSMAVCQSAEVLKENQIIVLMFQRVASNMVLHHILRCIQWILMAFTKFGMFFAFNLFLNSLD